MNKIIVTLIIFANLSFAVDAVEIKVNQPGKIIIEVALDTAWVSEKDNKIYTIPSLDSYFEPGLPLMPYFQDVLLGVPADAQFSIFQSEKQSLGKYTPIIIEQNKAKGTDHVVPIENHFDGFFPKNVVEMSQTLSLNNLPNAKLKIFPFKIENGNLHYHRNMSVQILWDIYNQSKPAKRLSKTKYNELQTGIKLNKPSANFVPEYQFSNNIAKIVVDSSAWYKITGSELLANGIDLSNIDPKTIRLWYKDDEMPLYLETKNTNGFSGDDMFVFWGEHNPPPEGADYEYNFYTNDNVYWLTWGGEPGLRFEEIDAALTLPANEVIVPEFFIDTLKVEEQIRYFRLYHNNKYFGNKWDVIDHIYMAASITPTRIVTKYFDLWNPVTTSNEGFKIEIKFYGKSYETHNVFISMNDNELFEAVWTWQDSYFANNYESDSFPTSVFNNGQNKLTLQMAESNFGRIEVDWFKIIYPRYFISQEDHFVFHSNVDGDSKIQFNISNLSNSELFLFKDKEQLFKNYEVVLNASDGTYQISLQDDNSKSEYELFTYDKLINVKKMELMEPIEEELKNIRTSYLAIGPDSFKTVLEPLVKLRNGVLVDVEDIYRQYNGGSLSPYAIKNFINDIYTNGDLEHVLLAMQANLYDQCCSQSANQRDAFIPGMHMMVYAWGDLVSDYWYSLMDDDLLPDLAIGRFPAADINELSIMVEKTINYENREHESWDNNVLLIGGYETIFISQSENLAKNIIESGSFLTRSYVATDTLSNLYYHGTDTLLSHFDRGISYVNFIGHGGGHVWSDAALIDKDDIENETIRNGNRLPFVTSMTCFTGEVSLPNSLGRYMLRNPYGGAINWFGSSGPGWVWQDYQMVIPLQKALFSNEGLSVGKLINKSKIEYFLNSHQSYIDISQLYQFNLIGDPAVQLKRPNPTSISYSPADPQAGEVLTLDATISPTDSVYYQVYTPDNYSENYPTFTNSGFSTTASLADTLVKGWHRINAGFKSNSELYNSSLPININGSFVNIQSILPVVITNCDSINVIAEVIDRDGISKVQLLVNGDYWADMESTTGDLYALSKLVPPQPSPSSLVFECRVIDMNNDTTLSEPVSVFVNDIPDVVPLIGEFTVDDQISMLIDVESKTTTPVDVAVELYVNEIDHWELVGKDTINFDGIGTVEAQISGYFPFGTNYYKVVTVVDFTCAPSYDNTNYFYLETTAFWVTPELGSTDNGTTHSKIGIKNIEVEIPTGLVTEPGIMQFTSITDVEIPAQPEFSVNQTERENVGLKVNGLDSLDYSINWIIGKSDVQSNNKLYKYFNEKRIWLPIKYSAISDSTINFEANGRLEIFTFLNNTDVKKPSLVETTINGQKFLRNNYLGANPTIQISVYDKNGIDFRPDSITYLLNNNVLDELSQEISGTGNTVNIDINPTLTAMDSTFSLLIQDAAGNVSDTLRLSFIVSEELGLIDYGNFPNPFSTTTVLTYDLSETVDELTIDIYTIKGRKIRSLTQASSQTALEMTTGGFHEIIWDGMDELGKKVGNGVYFYILRAKKGKNNIEKIGKMVVSR